MYIVRGWLDAALQDSERERPCGQANGFKSTFDVAFSFALR